MITPQNPVGLKGIDVLEFTADNNQSPTIAHFRNLGFQLTHADSTSHDLNSRKKQLFQQGQIRFLMQTTTDPHAHSRRYFQQHGEGVSKIVFRVDHLEASLDAALARGGVLKEDIKIVEGAAGKIKRASIQGFGDVLNEFVERPQEVISYELQNIATDTDYRPLHTRCSRIDHLTNNVPKGQMEHWVEFYKKLYGFVETRYFDIKGLKTGLFSKVVQSSDNSIIIPINEPEIDHGKSQIQEFLDQHKGPGVQHIALMTPNILSTVPELRERGFKFLDVPPTYYQDLPKRPFKVQEDIADLAKYSILCDGDQEGYLLQIFTTNTIGPLFFEFIQRKNHWGFGEGNFKALFDSIERDQMQRGYLK